MKVSEVMSQSVKIAHGKTPYRELWKSIFKLHIHAIPVSDTKNTIIGIVSEEDLLKPLYPNYVEYIEDFTTVSNFEDLENKVSELVKLTARDVMNSHVIFTRPQTPILRALSRMIVRDVRQLPVVSDDGVLVGMISKGDIFDSLFKRYLQKNSTGKSIVYEPETRKSVRKKSTNRKKK